MTFTANNIRNYFSEFYSNPTIQRLGEDRAWSVSDNNKMPVNIPLLLTWGSVHGASMYKLDTQAVTLDELTHGLPDAANCAFYLQAYKHHVAILDIEKTCPLDIRDRLLSLAPEALYTETSMSGKGYHLIFPISDDDLESDALLNKAKLQHPQGHYEILLSHWVTFTRNPIPQSTLDHALSQGITTTWNRELYELADIIAQRDAQRMAVYNAIDDIDISHLQPRDYSAEEQRYDHRVRDNISNQFDNWYTKDLIDDFDNDTSRWEFSILTTLARYAIADIQKSAELNIAGTPTTITPEHIVRIIYPVVQEKIPHREKHDGFRNGHPYLFWQTMKAVEVTEVPDINKSHTNIRPKENWHNNHT